MSLAGKKVWRHLLGLGLAVFALLLIVWGWRDGLRLLNGTAFSELRYLLFAGFVVGLLTAMDRLLDRILH